MARDRQCLEIHHRNVVRCGAAHECLGAVRIHQDEVARGVDRSPVVANRVSKSISAEDTFPTDLPLPELQPAIHRLAEKVWNASRANARQARTIVLKLKTRSSPR